MSYSQLYPPTACEVNAPAADKRNKAARVPQIYITGGSVPAGASLDDIENEVDSCIKTELEGYFKKWQLEKAVVTLQVENGKVKALAVKSFTGKKCVAAVLEKIFKKLKLQSEIEGNVEIALEYS